MGEVKTNSSRLLSLDILRGITIAGMILVNNPGSWGRIYAPLSHADWNGLTPTDLVFPFFMFIMGISAYFSLRRYDFKLDTKLFTKIIRRTLILFLLGWAVQWFSHFCRTLSTGTFADAVVLNNLRILGVLQRLAICYCVAALIACTVKFKRIPWIIAGLLIVYSLMLVLGNGYEISLDNIIYQIDNAVLKPNHMYHPGAWAAINDQVTLVEGYGTQKIVGAAFDPEGLCSTLPAIAHVLVGFCFGKLITTIKDNDSRIKNMLLLSGTMMMVAWLLSYGMPLNKNLWSPTFVLMTCGMAATLLSLLIWIIDVQNKKKWSRFFESFGINPLFMYLMGSVLSILFSSIRVPMGEESVSIHDLIYKNLFLNLLGENLINLASCLYAIVLVCITWCIGYVLYKKKIYIKI